MLQMGLLPEKIRRIDPCMARSVDAIGIGVALSGQRYLLKATVSWNPKQHVSEWLCNGLAQTLHLAVPAWTHCIMPDGRDAIGSRLEGNILAREFIPTERPSTENPDVVSRTLVLDMFVANADRHHGQWLLTEAGGARLLRPIDYSRAWFKRWPLPTPPFGRGAPLDGENDNSDPYYRIARDHGVVVRQEAEAAVNCLRELPKATWKRIIASVPEGWLQVQEVRELENWWWSPQWHTRLEWIGDQL